MAAAMVAAPAPAVAPTTTDVRHDVRVPPTTGCHARAPAAPPRGIAGTTPARAPALEKAAFGITSSTHVLPPSRAGRIRQNERHRHRSHLRRCAYVAEPPPRRSAHLDVP